MLSERLSVLLGRSFPTPLARDSKLFFFFLSFVPLRNSGFQSSLAPSLECLEDETQLTHCHAVLQVLAFFPLFRAFLRLLFVLC